MNSFEKQQAAKILNCYNTDSDIEKGRKATPIGQLDKSGKNIKTANGWEPVKKDKNKVEDKNLPTWFNPTEQLNFLKQGKSGGMYNTQKDAENAISEISKLSKDNKFEIEEKKVASFDNNSKRIIESRYTLKLKNNIDKNSKEEYSDIKQGNITQDKIIDAVLNDFDKYVYNGGDTIKFLSISKIAKDIAKKGAIELTDVEWKDLSKKIKPIIEEKYKKWLNRDRQGINFTI